MICRDDLTEKEWESILSKNNSMGLKKASIVNAKWRCIVDLVKRKITGGSQTSNIAIWMLPYVNGLIMGSIYNWAQLLFERMKEFVELRHTTFYMPHHVIAIFLEALHT